MSTQEYRWFVAIHYYTFVAPFSCRRVAFVRILMVSIALIRLYRCLFQRSSISGLIWKLNVSWMTIEPGLLLSRSVLP